VLLTDIDVVQGEAACAALVAKGAKARFVRHDVADRGQWEVAVKAALEFTGSLDVIVNNAGIGLPGTIETCTAEEWRKTLAINLDGVFHGMQLGVLQMKQQTSGGAIVNLASIEGFLGEPLAAAYNATKGGVRILSKSAAAHCARAGYRIRINCVCPGFVETPLITNALASMPAETAQAFQQKVLLKTPMGRLAQPAEIASMILYLASDEASYITGADMLVDGGLTAA